MGVFGTETEEPAAGRDVGEGTDEAGPLPAAAHRSLRMRIAGGAFPMCFLQNYHKYFVGCNDAYAKHWKAQNRIYNKQDAVDRAEIIFAQEYLPEYQPFALQVQSSTQIHNAARSCDIEMHVRLTAGALAIISLLAGR